MTKVVQLFPAKAIARAERQIIDAIELTEEQREQQELFEERRRRAGYCRWMASRFAPRPLTA